MLSIRYDTGCLLVLIIMTLGYAGGYKAKFLIFGPLVMVIFPCRQPIQASAVANQGLPKINGCPSSQVLGFIIKKSVGYFQESTKTMTSCSVPSSLTTDRSANSSKVEVGSTDVMPNFWQVVVVKMLIATPRSTKALGKV